ncbi:FabD/lysophospholipase-like protein [Lentinus brumalis]|uniref:FabD/lysophospholipase-like protein n=1 Tax=Lentinus brumalis TaxID=2498619 RepID=A0A371CUT7_9APHY|nr:FabD/lysophospholipase-like protein [Polyporus brumalis]
MTALCATPYTLELPQMIAVMRCGDSPDHDVEHMSSFDFVVQRETDGLPVGRLLTNIGTSPKFVFVFSGEGTQYFDMGRELFRTCEPFRESILELDQAYESVVGISLVLSTGLFDNSANQPTDVLGDPWPIVITLPALIMFQLAVVDALAVAGVRPDVVVGHSSGEIAVLCASGAAGKLVALKLAIAQGQALTRLEGAEGAMAAMSCTSDQARSIIAEVCAELGEGVLEIACYNAPQALTLSGQEAHVELAVSTATTAGIPARRLNTRIPVHTSMMELCRAEFMQRLSNVFPIPAEGECVPKVPVYSSVTGGLFNGSFDPEYFWGGTVQPVLFQDAVEEMLLRHETVTFVEIGPQPGLASHLHAMTTGNKNITVTYPLPRIRNTQMDPHTAEPPAV